VSDLSKLEPEAIELVATPGYRFFAPAGTPAPTARVEGGRFVDTWPMAWLPLNELQRTPMLRLTSYQKATGDTALLSLSRTSEWAGIDIPAGSIGFMLGWESGSSDLRVVGQGVIAQSWLDELTRAMYAR
jgi:hypothetical protein